MSLLENTIATTPQTQVKITYLFEVQTFDPEGRQLPTVVYDRAPDESNLQNTRTNGYRVTISRIPCVMLTIGDKTWLAPMAQFVLLNGLKPSTAYSLCGKGGRG